MNQLGTLYGQMRQFGKSVALFKEALRWCRKAREPNPANPIYRQHLGNSLTGLIEASRALGDSAGASEAERELAELRDSNPAMKAMDSRLRAVIKGEQKPASEGERLQLAQRAYDKALHKTAAKLWSDALDANSKLGDDRQAQHRYNAACATALAGCGKGKDDPPPSDDEKTKLRRQSLDWLKTELDVWTKLAQSANNDQRGAIARMLQHWKEDPDLAGIRDDAELAKLPASERAEFVKVWSDLDALLKKNARAAAPPRRVVSRKREVTEPVKALVLRRELAAGVNVG